MLPRLGHVPMGDDPATVAEAIVDFTGRAGAQQEALARS
jgi:hypothetical protein